MADGHVCDALALNDGSDAAMTMLTSGSLTAVLFLLGVSASAEDRWEETIRAFEERDKRNPPPPGAIVFVGSSTIVGWDLAKHFPGLPSINRGFGGSQLADCVRYVDRIVIPYKPRMVVLYAGDNDIAAGKSPYQVTAEFEAFVQKVHTSLPQTMIVFVPIKPSLARWKLVDKMRQANTMISRIIARHDHCVYADIDWALLGEDGRPRPEFYKPDGLHLSEEGYVVWSKLLWPYLESEIH